MSDQIRPSSMEGIKRLAKRIKREREISHSDALNEAAKIAGFQNFRHATNAFKSQSEAEQPAQNFSSLEEFHQQNLAKWIAAVQTVNPRHANQLVWYDPNEILRALKPFLADAFNHAHLPTGGGQDYISAKLSRERDCVEFKVDDELYHVCRPTRLILESISADLGQSFLLLELGNLRLSGVYDHLHPREEDEEAWNRYMNWDREELVDANGRYYERDYWYSENRSDEERPPPNGARHISRWLGGKILIVAKGSIWNGDPGTYDGRHNTATSSQIRNAIERSIVQ